MRESFAAWVFNPAIIIIIIRARGEFILAVNRKMGVYLLCFLGRAACSHCWSVPERSSHTLPSFGVLLSMKLGCALSVLHH